MRAISRKLAAEASILALRSRTPIQVFAAENIQQLTRIGDHGSAVESRRQLARIMGCKSELSGWTLCHSNRTRRSAP